MWLLFVLKDKNKKRVIKMNKECYKLKNYNEEGLRLKNQKKYLLQKQYLLELKKRLEEGLEEYEQKRKKK